MRAMPMLLVDNAAHVGPHALDQAQSINLPRTTRGNEVTFPKRLRSQYNNLRSNNCRGCRVSRYVQPMSLRRTASLALNTTTITTKAKQRWDYSSQASAPLAGQSRSQSVALSEVGKCWVGRDVAAAKRLTLYITFKRHHHQPNSKFNLFSRCLQ